MEHWWNKCLQGERDGDGDHVQIDKYWREKFVTKLSFKLNLYELCVYVSYTECRKLSAIKTHLDITLGHSPRRA